MITTWECPKCYHFVLICRHVHFDQMFQHQLMINIALFTLGKTTLHGHVNVLQHLHHCGSWSLLRLWALNLMHVFADDLFTSVTLVFSLFLICNDFICSITFPNRERQTVHAFQYIEHLSEKTWTRRTKEIIELMKSWIRFSKNSQG